MRYILAVLLPPLAVLSCGKFWQAFFNLILTLFLWVPGIIHAMLVVSNYHDEQRTERLIEAMRDDRDAERPSRGRRLVAI